MVQIVPTAFRLHEGRLDLILTSIIEKNHFDEFSKVDTVISHGLIPISKAACVTSLTKVIMNSSKLIYLVHGDFLSKIILFSSAQ
jgi:hypothetical protein